MVAGEEADLREDGEGGGLRTERDPEARAGLEISDGVPVHEHGHMLRLRAVRDGQVVAAGYDERAGVQRVRATKVIAIASSPHIITGPPFERL